MKSRTFRQVDVFAPEPCTGNPVAVVLDAEDLDTAAMQALAAEFNLSETVFVLPPETPRHRARMRIFTPTSELPFAGHPTLGTAILLLMGCGVVANAILPRTKGTGGGPSAEVSDEGL